MGLRDYRKYKKELDLKNSETISFLTKRIEELENEVKELKSQRTTIVKTEKMSEKDKARLKALQEKTSPQDFINLFTDDLEEFDPNA